MERYPHQSVENILKMVGLNNSHSEMQTDAVLNGEHLNIIVEDL